MVINARYNFDPKSMCLIWQPFIKTTIKKKDEKKNTSRKLSFMHHPFSSDAVSVKTKIHTQTETRIEHSKGGGGIKNTRQMD